MIRKKLFSVLASVTLIATSLFIPHQPAEAASITNNATYQLINRNSGKALEIFEYSHDNGGNAVQWADLNGDNQYWRFVSVGSGYYSLVNANSGRALEVLGWSTADGGNVVQWQNFSRNYNQHWRLVDIDGHVQLINRHSGKALEVYNHSTADGANVVQWTSTGNPNQQWQLVKVSPNGTTTVNSTIVVEAGQVFDGLGRHYVAGSALGDGSQDEGQDPVFRLENGATLKNVVIGAPAADGVHVYGNAYLANIVWEDIGEDALTLKSSGTVTLNGGAAYNGADKVIMLNAPGRLNVYNFVSSNAGKLIRQVGGSTFKVEVFIDSSDISNMDESIFRTDSTTSTVSMTNTIYSNVGQKWYNVKNVYENNNTEY